jgi:hypothetical protein
MSEERKNACIEICREAYSKELSIESAFDVTVICRNEA